MSFKSLTLTLGFGIFGSVLTQAQYVSQTIPNKLWERFEVADLAIFLNGGKNTSDHEITIYVKNKSKDVEEIFDSSSTEQGFRFRMVDRDGIRQLLPHIKLDEGKKNRIQRIEAAMESGWSQAVNPGEKVVVTIGISPSDLALIKSHPMQCSVSLLDSATGQRSQIDSSPKLLPSWP